MKKSIIFAAVLSAFALGSMTAPASAQDMATCTAKAVGSNGKPLSGAAKTSSINKCMQSVRDACEAKATGSNGKKLSGAALKSFMTKCEKGG